MTDLLKLPCAVLLSLVLVVSKYGDIGTYNMLGEWVVKTVSFFHVPYTPKYSSALIFAIFARRGSKFHSILYISLSRDGNVAKINCFSPAYVECSALPF